MLVDPVFGVALTVAFLWGLQSLMQKYLMVKTNLSSSDFVILSGLCYAIIVVIFYLFFHRHQTQIHTVPIEDYGYTFIFTLLCIFLPNLLFLWCITNREVSSILGITLLSPVFTLGMGYLLFSHTINVMQFIGICMMVAGGVLLTR